MKPPKIPDDPDFTAEMSDVRPLQNRSGRVSAQSTAPIMINPDRSRPIPRRPLHGTGASEMDSATLKHLKAGKIRPQARLDLHGYRADAARAAVIDFVTSAAARGLRCVLVVTGKGGAGTEAQSNQPWGTEGRSAPGVLRRSLPEWAAATPLDGLVLRASAAAPEDGGSGAYYLYLRRTHNKNT